MLEGKRDYESIRQRRSNNPVYIQTRRDYNPSREFDKYYIEILNEGESASKVQNKLFTSCNNNNKKKKTLYNI